MFLAQNLKLLRKRKALTQDETAEKTGLSRTKLNAYENAHSEPTIQNLMLLADFYNLNLDTLLKKDLSQLSSIQLQEMESGYDSFISGTNLRVLSSIVDQENQENIELIPLKAKAGYKTGFNDPEFLAHLPTFQLPFLSRDKKYRSFQLDGDSMLPIKDRSYVVGEFVQNWFDLKDGEACVILTADDGIVFKVIYNHLKTNKTFLLHSLNDSYEDYQVSVNEVREIWKFVCYISTQMPDEGVSKNELLDAIQHLELQLDQVKKKIF